MPSVVLASGIRSTLLTLQTVDNRLGRTQERLATGMKVNSALDAPPVFFAAKSLTQKAGDLVGIKDAIGQAISTVQAGSKGAEKIQELVAQARGLTTAAMGAMGNDVASVAIRKNLSQNFDKILDAINGIVDDNDYQGKNLIKGNGARIDATIQTKLDVSNIRGIDRGFATNTKSEDAYRVQILGSGAIAGDPAHVADAEQERGIRPIYVEGMQSSDEGNFNPVSIEVKGAPGRDKQITVGNAPESTTVTFTRQQWEAAKSSGQPLTVDHSFSSGTRVKFNVDFDAIEATKPNYGQGISTIEKRVDLRVKVSNNQNISVIRDVNAPLGSGRLANGENAFEFPTGTVRLNVDEKKLMPLPPEPITAPPPAPPPPPPSWSGVPNVAGGAGVTTNTYVVGATTGTVSMSYDMFSVPDQADIYYNGSLVASTTGPVSGTGSLSFHYPASPANSFDVVITGSSGTAWEYTLMFAPDSTSPPSPPAPPTPDNPKNVLVTKLSVPPTTANDLLVSFDTAQVNTISVQSQNLEVSGQGLQVDFSQNEWREPADVQHAIEGLDIAEQKLRSASQVLASNMGLITTRDKFSKDFSDILVDGFNKLTLADQNEEGAKMLALQTRQQLATTTLSMAAQAQQAILSLFR